MARRDAWPTNRSRIGLSTAAVNEGTVLRWCFPLLAVTMMVGLLGLADGVEAVPLGSPSDFIGASIVINFDDAIGGTSNPAVSGDDARTRYAAQGVTFSNSPGGPIPILNWSALGRSTTSAPNVVATIASFVPGGSQFSTDLILDFSTPMFELGAYFGNDQGPGSIDRVTLSVFDASGALIESVSVTPNDNTSVDQFIGLRTATPFVRARFDYVEPSNFLSVVLDDVRFSPVATGIAGRITGAGVGLPGAVVDAFSAVTGAFVATAATDASGNYAILLAPGTYKIKAHFSGFLDVFYAVGGSSGIDVTTGTIVTVTSALGVGVDIALPTGGTI